MASTLALRALRTQYPHATIDFLTLTNFADLLSTSNVLDQARTFDRRTGPFGLIRLRRSIAAERYDVVVDLHASLRSRIISFGTRSRRLSHSKPLLRRVRKSSMSLTPIPLRYLSVVAPLGAVDDGNGLEIPTKSVNLLPYSKGIGPVIVLAPGAQHASKRWEPERFAEALREVDPKPGAVVIVGGAEDGRAASTIVAWLSRDTEGLAISDYTGRTSWMQTARIIADADIVIANDSVAGHIAAAVGTPVVSILASTHPRFGFAPFRVPVRVIEPSIELACRPCTTTGTAVCKRGDFACLAAIKGVEVGSAARELLDERSR